MIEVIDNLEMPATRKAYDRYPNLEVGQGFIIPPLPRKELENKRTSIYATYTRRGYRVATHAKDGCLFVKRIA